MNKRVISFLLTLVMIISMVAIFPQKAYAASLPTAFWVEPSETNGLPASISLFKARTGGNNNNPTYTYQLYLPGNINAENCYLFWDGGLQATVGGVSYASGECPIPDLNSETTYSFKNGNQTTSFKLISYQGSPSVQVVFIEVDESDGKPTIEQMDGDADHEVTCSGTININGTWYNMPKIKGRGNATWDFAEDKKPYNVTIETLVDGNKINFPGIDSDKTKKWSFLAEVTDHSLMSNRTGYHLAYTLGIGQDTTSADVWMNGEYQGCYTVTPKTDSFVTKNGYMIEQDNYLEPSVASGGDPQFQLDGMIEVGASWGGGSGYNRITVKKMGSTLLGAGGEDPDNMEDIANNTIKPWLQDAWDAIRADGDKINFGYGKGRNSKNKYYTDYIDIESFAKMYLMHEYAKSFDVCAGSILFHRDGMTDNDKLIAGPMWDLDNAMGSTCQNSALGKADDRRNGDRRSGEGSFIANVTEYKTSIYKTLSQHTDFMEEVTRQYNKYKAEFDALPAYLEQITSEISDSAKMNHYKVNDIKTDYGFGQDYKNTHKYKSTDTRTFGSGEYAQSYLATTDSKTDWPNYAANLLTYVQTRSRWFANNYYDENYACEHEYVPIVTPSTCTAEGYTTYVCTFCGDSYIDEDSSTPKIAHDYQDGVCSVCGETLLNVSIVCDDGATVTVYETQDLEGACVESAVSANPRDGSTGLIDCSGDGQVNLVVNVKPGYTLTSVTAEPTTAYKNLKGPSETGHANYYRITKITGNLSVTVTTVVCEHEYESVVTDPTCTSEGFTTHTCTKCGHSYIDDTTPKLPHEYHDGVCTVCGETLITVSFACDEGVSITVYETQNLSGAYVENAASANPRDGSTGLIDCSGDGQVNFVVNLQPGYELAGIAADPTGTYKNLKDQGANYYRLTKVTGDCTITVNTIKVEQAETPSNITSTTMDLNGKLYLNVLINLSNEVMEDSDAYITTIFNGETTIHFVAELIQNLDDSGRVRVSQEMFAAMLRDEVTLQLINGAGEVQPLTYKNSAETMNSFVFTALEYLRGRQANSTNQKMIALALATELYGTAAQIHFGYHTEQLTAEDIAAVEAAANAITIPSSYAETVTGTLPAGVTKRTKTMLIESDNSLRQYFYIEDANIGNYTFTLNGDPVTPRRKEAGKYYVQQSNIASALLSTEYTFTVSDGTDTYTIQCSAVGYAYGRQEKSDDPTMVNLAKLLYRYSLAADEYFAGQQ